MSESALENMDQMCELAKSLEDNLIEDLTNIVKKEIKEKLNLQENEFEILTNWRIQTENSPYSKFYVRELKISVKTVGGITISFIGTYDVEYRNFDGFKNRYVLQWFRVRLKRDDVKKLVTLMLFR